MENNTIFSQIFSERWQELPVKLKHQVVKLNNEKIKIIERKVEANSKNSKTTEKLSLSEIALLYVYMDKSIENPDEIAKKYGYSSGKKLKDDYNKYQYKSNRQGDAGKRANSYQINRLKKVINILPENKKARAEEDLNSLIEKQERIHM